MAVSKAIALVSWITVALMAHGVRGEGEEWTRAMEAPQFIRRQTAFQGGWPMALAGSTCPANLVLCKGIISNPSCCPSGSTCNGSGYEYCCPDKTDCESYLKNFPQCADPSHTLYVLGSYAYFCCPKGQFGVLPLSGYGGFCQDDGKPVDPTRVATAAKEEKTVIDFVTSVGATLTTRTTLANGAATTVLVSFSSRTTVTETRNKIGEPTTVTQVGANTDPANSGASPIGGSNGNSTNNGGGGRSGISAGAIAGIVIGALAVLAIFALAFVLYRRKKPNTNKATAVGQESPAPKYAGYAQPTEQRQDMSNYPIPVTPGSSTAVPASSMSGYSAAGNAGGAGHVAPPPAASEPSWGTRAELGGGGR